MAVEAEVKNQGRLPCRIVEAYTDHPYTGDQVKGPLDHPDIQMKAHGSQILDLQIAVRIQRVKAPDLIQEAIVGTPNRRGKTKVKALVQIQAVAKLNGT